jgi:hypothetical protein
MPTESRRAKRATTVEWVAIDVIDPASYNPRKMRPGPFSKLKRSLEEFGQVDPLIVNRVNNRLVGGHQRLRALQELGKSEVLVSWVDEPNEEREKALNIALNNAELAGEWDTTKLADLLDSIKDQSVALLSGFDQHQIAQMIAKTREEVAAPVYPLAQKMLEHYDYVIVFATNETDWVNLQSIMGLETEHSYKKEKIGLGRVVTFERFIERWRSRADGQPRPREAAKE